ncbi:Ig-like domain-containing protein [Acidaminobacter hydrogenoformans]|uniref:SLH domain-containing protein n=1 Tax=Acidaminobacter hydrogenoformans DSM 2784 TaxID=1120920 RepID=A0A1G5RY43_9FIRM|nr:Ig-like domain-containing protein [Acidaminobacter hydrogenoformans]SCZ79034.1 hypothetical protein SAMN03080599_01558 [Acidaminobacter hydrogenoformans DSM 2784]
MRKWMVLLVAAILFVGTAIHGYSAPQTSGEILKSYGLVTGDYNGDLTEDAYLTRAEMMVLLARMMGEFEQASEYEARSTFVDGGGTHWAERYVAYAQSRGWTAGIGGNRFGYEARHTIREASVFMLKALGYRAEVDFTFATAYDFAVRLGLMVPGSGLEAGAAGIDPDADILRGQVFDMMLQTLNTSVKGLDLALIHFVETSTEALHVEAVRPVNRTSLELVFSEAISELGTVTVEAPDGLMAVTGLRSSGSHSVIVTVGSEMGLGAMYDVTAREFVSEDDNVSVYYFGSMLFEQDFSPVRAEVISASHTAFALKFSRPVLGLTAGHVFYGEDGNSPLGIYKDAALTQPVVPEEAVSEVHVWLAYKSNGILTGVPLKVGTSEVFIAAENNEGRALTDTWGEPYAGGALQATVSGDLTAPSVTRMEMTSANALRLEFSEDVSFGASNMDVKFSTGALIPNLWLSVSGSGRVYTVQLNDANLEGKSIRVNVRNVPDQAFIPNVLSVYTATFTIPEKPDVERPYVVTAVKDTVSKYAYVTFNKPVDVASATVRSRYAVSLSNSSFVLSRTPVQINGGRTYRLSLTNTEYTLSQSTGAQLTVTGVKDLSGNTMTAQNFSFAAMTDVSKNPPQLVSVYATDSRSVTAVFSQPLTRVDAGAFKLNFNSVSNLTYTVSGGQTVVKFQSPSALPANLSSVSLFVDTSGYSKVQNLYGINVKNTSKKVEDRR